MGYSANILKTDAFYYTLDNASIADNTLTINADGSAMQVIDLTMLASLTSTFKFSCISTEYADRYQPDIFITIHALHTDSLVYYNALLYPVQVQPNYYECIFSIDDGAYDEMYFSIHSLKNISLSLWELRPEAPDSDIETIIDGVKQSLPRLLYDYNTFPFDISQAETTIAVITCNLLQNTDLQGHFLFTFVASTLATVTLRFYDNEAEELFAPLYYDARLGNNTIGVPHAYLQRLAGIHSFVVTAQTAAGSLHVDTRRILFTIDGGYLATRELDIAMDVNDLAVRQLISSDGPDTLYLIGLDAGEAMIRSRDYAETNAAVSFDVVGSVGRASAAAVEFDGIWKLRDGASKYTLETEEEPWYFWVNELYELCACHGLPTEDNPHTVLATAVADSVKACKGYSSEINPEQDQGLIVAYLKYDGYAYYRQYAYSTVSQNTQWLPEYRLPVGDEQFTSINVHRLNDYRIGFELSGRRNVWIISDRTYVGQSAYPENAYISGLYTENDMYEPFVGYYTQVEYPMPNVKSIVAETELRERAWVDSDKQVHRETYTVYRWVMVLDKAVFGSQIITSNADRISCSNIRDPFTKTLEYNLLTNETIITVESEYPPQALITSVTLNSDNYLRVQDNGVIFPFISGSVTGTVDKTNYIAYTAPDDNGIINASTSFSITEYAISYPVNSTSDETSISGTTQINLQEYGINFITKNMLDEAAISGAATYTIFYGDSRYDPI